MKKWKVLDNILLFLLIFFILLAICAYPIAYWFPYEKKVYEQTEPITWETLEEARAEADSEENVEWNFSGYPTKDMHTELKSLEQFLDNMWSATCLEVNVEDLRPTGMYKRVHTISAGSGWAPGYTDSYLQVILNRGNAIYAQYYVLELEDRSDLLVLLNDTVVEIPKKGTLQLPYAYGSIMSEDESITRKLIGKYGVEKDELGDPYYLDASEHWMMFNDALEEAEEERAAIFVISLSVGIIGFMAMIGIAIVIIVTSPGDNPVPEDFHETVRHQIEDDF